MGFMKEKYSNNQGGLVVVFNGEQNGPNYFAGNNIQDALEYFNMYIKDNQIFIRTDEELALQETGISTIEEAALLRQEINEIINDFTDEQAVEKPFLFPNWKVGVSYVANTRVRYGGRIFKVLQNHTSQEDWTPSRAPSLFAEVLTNENGEPAEWQQPSSTNPYLVGDKVIYNGIVYESLIDNNVWSPEAYPAGWQRITPEQEPEPEPNVEPEYSEWVQPDAGNPYMTGDRVLYNGSVYESTIDNNVWSPETYPAGWTLIE
jgi:hypothetical protein